VGPRDRGGCQARPGSALGVVPVHIIDKVRALVLGFGLSKLQSDGGLSCSMDEIPIKDRAEPHSTRSQPGIVSAEGYSPPASR